MDSLSPPPASGCLRGFGFALVVALAVAAGYAGHRLLNRLPRLPPPSVVVDPETALRHTLRLLRSQDLTFLATERLVSQVSIGLEDSRGWSGLREGELTGLVRLYYGLDLSGLSPDALVREDGRWILRLPEPRVLDVAVDLESLRYRTRESVLNRLWDRLRERDLHEELRQRFAVAAEGHFRDHGLLPAKEDLCARLNAFTAGLLPATSPPLEFR